MPGPLWKITHTQSGRKWRWSFRVNVTSQQLWLILTLCVTAWPRDHRTGAQREKGNCYNDLTQSIWFILLLLLNGRSILVLFDFCAVVNTELLFKSAAAATDPVHSCSNLIWSDTAACVSKRTVMTCAHPVSASDALLLFPSTRTKTASWASWHISESALWLVLC